MYAIRSYYAVEVLDVERAVEAVEGFEAGAGFGAGQGVEGRLHGMAGVPQPGLRADTQGDEAAADFRRPQPLRPRLRNNFV